MNVQKTLKEIVKENSELLARAQELLKEKDKDAFFQKYDSVVKEILCYRNGEIDAYILGLKNQGVNTKYCLQIPCSMSIYVVQNESDLDELGKAVQQLMQKCVDWYRVEA